MCGPLWTRPLFPVVGGYLLHFHEKLNPFWKAQTFGDLCGYHITVPHDKCFASKHDRTFSVNMTSNPQILTPERANAFLRRRWQHEKSNTALCHTTV